MDMAGPMQATESRMPSGPSHDPRSLASPSRKTATALANAKDTIKPDHEAKDAVENRVSSPPSVPAAAPWRRLAKVAAGVLYHVYLAAGVVLRWSSSPDFCHGIKFLVVMTAIVYLLVLVNAAAALIGRFNTSSIRRSTSDAVERLRPCLWFSLWACLLAFLVYDAFDDIYRLTSLTGIAVLLFLGFVFSKYPTK
ncbi:hypothetical protein MTO96_041637, partial [Rhipicephalus appendiculatus]